ncbi:TPA: ASCH domain-containing protein [Pasteurella multocida]|uniref:ASCH domain-containing protein n=1 Tax=Pasteurella multocida TaxID=747 RepID=UPI00330128B8|nr:ASCH domain-containing protein [Pasteurella multocida]
MRALSIKQPWAYLIASEQKTIEVRSWSTDYRGPLLICASSAEQNAWVLNKQEKAYTLLPSGVMMCVCDLVDVRLMTEEDREMAWASDDDKIEGLYAWVLSNPKTVMFNKVIGKLRLFDVDDELIVPMSDESKWLDYAKELQPAKAKINMNSLIFE